MRDGVKKSNDEGLGKANGWVTINDGAKVGGIVLLCMKRDGTSGKFLGKEGAPKCFWIGMEVRDDL